MICDVRLARRADPATPAAEALSPAERRRLGRYVRAADRSRFATGAALLRQAAADWLRLPPQDVVVDRTCPRCGNQHGPPRLPGTPLHASVSHSGDVVAVAVTDAGPVGVDVEQIGVADYARLLGEVCVGEELPFVGGAADFYSYWTRKEAFLKATAEGLTRPMTDIVVSPPRLPPAVLAVRNGPSRPALMRDLSVEGYSGTAVVLTSATLQWNVTDPAKVTLFGTRSWAYSQDVCP